MTTRPSISLEYARVKITETQGLTISAASVELAFVAAGAEPIEDDWETGTWEGAAAPTRVARVLVGPTALVLIEGQYDVWYRFADTPERPARMAGRITIT